MPPFPLKGFAITAAIAGSLFGGYVARGAPFTRIVAGIMFGPLFALAAAGVWMLASTHAVGSRIDRLSPWKAALVMVIGIGLLVIAFLNPRIQETWLGPLVIWFLFLSVPVFAIRWLKRE